MNDHDSTKSLFDLFDAGTTIMFGTHMTDGTFASRPLTVARTQAHQLDVLIDSNTEWASAMHDGADAHVTLSDTRRNHWASLSGTVELSRDRGLIDELWSLPAEAFFDNGRETPGLAVLTFHVSEGRYWSSPGGRVGGLVSMIRAALGNSDDSGESGSISA